MPKISQRLIVPSQQVINLFKLAATKKVNYHLVRGMESGRALDWMIGFSQMRPFMSDGKDLDHLLVFDENDDKHPPRVYFRKEHRPEMGFAEIEEWLHRQPNAFANEGFRELIKQAASNGWLFSADYEDRKDASVITEDSIRFRAYWTDFNKKSRSGETLFASINEGNPNWDCYMYSEASIDSTPQMPKQADRAFVLDKLSTLAPTLPTPTR